MTANRTLATSVLSIAVYIHFVLPANVLFAAAIAIAWAAGSDPDVRRDEIVANAALLGLALAATGVCAIHDVLEHSARRRRLALGVAAHPDNSRDAVDHALAIMSDLSRADREGILDATMTRLRSARWDHDDPEMRRIANDLDLAATRMAPACRDEDRARATEAAARLAASADLILQGLDDAWTARREAERDEASTAARYVQTKYRSQI